MLREAQVMQCKYGLVPLVLCAVLGACSGSGSEGSGEFRLIQLACLAVAAVLWFVAGPGL